MLYNSLEPGPSGTAPRVEEHGAPSGGLLVVSAAFLPAVPRRRAGRVRAASGAMPDAAALLEAVRMLRAAQPGLGVKQLVARLRAE